MARGPDIPFVIPVVFRVTRISSGKRLQILIRFDEVLELAELNYSPGGLLICALAITL